MRWEGFTGGIGRTARTVGVVIVVGAIVGLVVRQLSILDQMMVYFPAKEITVTPADVGLAYDDVSLIASDGTRLYGWHVPGDSKTTLLWFHGNAGNISNRVDNIVLLNRQLGVGVFIIDYRGYGQSEGKPSEKGMYLDAQAAFDYAISDLGLNPEQDIVLFGRSLGAAVAVEMATRHKVNGVILESGFASVKDMAKVTHPFLPSSLVLSLVEARYDSISKIGQIESPVMILHGDRDEIIPFEMAGRLFDAANEPKRFYTIQGAHHNDTYQVGGERYFEALRDFIGGG